MSVAGDHLRTRHIKELGVLDRIRRNYWSFALLLVASASMVRLFMELPLNDLAAVIPPPLTPETATQELSSPAVFDIDRFLMEQGMSLVLVGPCLYLLYRSVCWRMEVLLALDPEYLEKIPPTMVGASAEREER